jgi:tetratricopeptide (TPR) repeat protein
MRIETAKERLEHREQQAEQHPGSATVQFNLGLAYGQMGHMDSAEKAYRKALLLDPDLVEAWVNLGGVLMLKWDFQGSLDANREALKRKEDLILAHYNTGQANLYLGNAEVVVQSYNRVVELDPGHAAGHYFLAVGLLATNHVQEARQSLIRAKAFGHSPQPDFLKAIGIAEEQLVQKTDPSIVTSIGAGAPKDSDRRK